MVTLLPSVASDAAARGQPCYPRPAMDLERGGGESSQNPVEGVRTIRFASLADLAAGIAHEINNPLAIILEAAGWIGDLLDEEDLAGSTNVDEVRRALRQIVTQGGRCKEITRNLLSFARRTSAQLEDLQLNQLVTEVVEAYTRRARERGVELVTQLDPELPTARLSATEMQQVLTNLLGNAIDALQPRGGRVVVRTGLVGDELHLEVEDDGPGIPESVLPRVFEPFFTTKPVGKGTGLGLAVCAGIVSSLGGSIAVETASGVGTTFHVRVPLEPAEPGLRPPKDAETVPAEVPGPATGRPAVVLVVDDELEYAETLCLRLGRRGLHVLVAGRVEQALEMVDTTRNLDVILLSAAMRGVDTIELLGELKRAEPRVEVILLAAHSSAETAIAGLRRGAFDYLLKPCDTEVLMGRIERARTRKQRREQEDQEARILEITSRRV